MILGFVIGVIFVALLVLAVAVGYTMAAQKIKLDEEQDLDDR